MHFCPDEIGLRFFRDTIIQFETQFNSTIEESIYCSFKDENQFLDALNKRMDDFDIVILTAHGYNSGIVRENPDSHVPPHNPYIPIITMDHSKHFKNNFIFAYSCYTLNQFGHNCVNGEKAISYIGFGDSIEDALMLEADLKGNFTIYLRKIVEKIYTNSFVETFENFLLRCHTANEFKEYFIISIERKINNLLKLDIKNINDLYNLDLKDSDKKELIKSVNIELLLRFEKFSENIGIEGEENYIPWYYIEDQPQNVLEELIQKINKISEDNTEYREFILSKAVERLKEYSKALEKCK